MESRHAVGAEDASWLSEPRSSSGPSSRGRINQAIILQAGVAPRLILKALSVAVRPSRARFPNPDD